MNLPASGRVVIERISSAILKQNALGDPAERDLFVYLPPSYYNDSSIRYPVVYCLAGFTSSARSWFNFQPWVPTIDQRMDRLISSGTPEMILVFPDCFTKYGGSQYRDSEATGHYRSYLLQEVIPVVDANYRTIADRKGRGVLGKSSGGYGALTIAMDHPQQFSAVVCHSGDIYFEYAYLPEFPAAVRALEKIGGLQKYLEQFDSLPKTSREDHALLNLVAMSACYSPNTLALPNGFDLPVREYTGELIPEVWNQWRQKDPIEIIRSDPRRLLQYGFIYLDCGKRDEFFLHFGARMFSNELKKAGTPHVYEEFEEGHFNVQHRYDRSLKLLADYFAGQ